MVNKKEILIWSMLLVLIISVNLISAQAGFAGGVVSGFTGGNYRVFGSSVNPQFTQPSFYGGSGINVRDYWMSFNREDCTQRQDVVLMIPPGGCSPSVVRSDLLEERNVPVFCKVASIQVNPLIDITKIRSIRFKRGEGKGFQASFFPARAAVRSSRTLEGSPIVDNVGYLVITLPRQEVEAEMPDWIEGNVTAVIDYDAEGVFGVGKHDFYLTEMDDDEWERSYKEYGFWKGKGFIRLDSVDVGSARVSIYRDGIRREATVNLKKGETSRDVYLDGYYCAAGMNIKLEDIDYPVDTALLKVDDEDVWVADGSRFLNGKCRVSSLEVFDVGGGKVSLKCSGVRGVVELMLGSANVILEGGDKESNEYSIGDIVKTSGDENIYLAYVGALPKGKGNLVVLIKSKEEPEVFNEKRVGVYVAGIIENYLDDPNILKILKILSEFERTAGNYVRSKIHSKYPGIDGDNIEFLVEGGTEYGISLKGPISGEAPLEQEQNKDLKEYYGLAVENYNEVFELYPNEREINDQNLETYSETALYNAAELSRVLGLKANQIKYLETLIENYPDSSLAIKAEQDKEEAYKGTVSKDSQAVVAINNEPHFISLRDFKKPSYEDLGAELVFNVGEESVKWRKDVRYIIPGIEDKDKKVIVEILEINEDSIKIKYFPPKEGVITATVNVAGQILIDENKIKGKTMTLEIGKETQLTSDITAKLVKTNLNKQAKVKIIPKTFGMRTESDLGFKIGIEKRAIKLSPEKTQEMIDNLDKNIEDWEKINDKLGKVVTGMKGACFATSAMLTVKNLFSGWSGESMARHEVMTASGGWNEKCRLAKANQQEMCGKPVSSVQQCLLNCNDEIEASIRKLAGYYKKENDGIEALQKEIGVTKTDALDWEGQVDYQKLKQKYCDKVKNDIDWNREIELKGKGKVSLSDIYSQPQVDNCDIDLDEIKLLKMRELVKDDAMLSGMMDKKLGSELIYTYGINEANRQESVLMSRYGDEVPIFVGDKTKYQVMADVSKLKEDDKKFDSEVTKIFSDTIDGQKVLVGLVNKKGNVYFVKQILREDGNVEDWGSYKGFSEFTLANSDIYTNEMKGDPKVKYYERAPYQGLPAQVPFDRENGWYVATDYILSGFGKPYEESGRAINFWICNAGKNGLIEYKQGDECRYYNRGTSQDLKFAGLSASESARLVQKADRAIAEASRQYKKGKKEVVILGQVFGTDIAENGESGKCSDFMSPQDCHLMFNICDPVLCPESRCDFGGEYRVANVIQSGIIGSLLLCLPNAQEGIMIPVCLTGVHAGIEGYLSILKSTQACLQESLETGRNIGICDEIKSVYLCEFFWRQAVPLMDVFIPRVFGAFFGQGVRGGGEYMTVDYAWENAKSSIDYFKNEYAVNAMKAFNDRSTSEIGGEVCKMFVGARYPSSKKFFDNLIEPDSPVQYHAWFSENVLTEATIPPTSHYKVYYHIYAGKDIGANYVVYLRNPPESAYVHTMARYVVDRGYISRGDQIDRARDFTGISGYQELCVNVNGQEECGFKKVSTSWAIDELSRRYAAEQASEGDITTSKQCVSGSPSLWSFAQPNLQAGAQEYVSPELYKRGIIRVCSSGNPGKQTTPSGELDRTNSTYDRWKRVGDCDVPEIGCWLDTNSVKNVLADAPGLTEQVLDEIDLNYLGEVEIMPPEEAISIVSEAKDLIGRAMKRGIGLSPIYEDEFDRELIDKLKRLTEFGPNNVFRAEAFFLIGQIYDQVARNVYSKSVEGREPYPSSDLKGAEEDFDDELGREVTEEESEVEFDWTDLDNSKKAMFEIQDGSWMNNIYYKWEGGGWKVSEDKKDWTNAEVFDFSLRVKMHDKSRSYIPFIRTLKDETYEGGIKKLILKTIQFQGTLAVYKNNKKFLTYKHNDRLLIEINRKLTQEGAFGSTMDLLEFDWTDLDNSEKVIFEIQDGSWMNNIYYRWKNKEWQVSENKKDWESVKDFDFGISVTAHDRSRSYIPFIRNLEGNTYEGGIKKLITKTIEFQGTLVVYKDNEKFSIHEYDDGLLIEINRELKD